MHLNEMKKMYILRNEKNIYSAKWKKCIFCEMKQPFLWNEVFFCEMKFCENEFWEIIVTHY